VYMYICIYILYIYIYIYGVWCVVCGVVCVCTGWKISNSHVFVICLYLNGVD